MPNFEARLSGGHPNSLGNTIEVVDEVLADGNNFDELFQCYFSSDEVVRLRVSNAMKRIAKVKKSLLVPYMDRFLTDIAAINQASTQWTLAQLFDVLHREMSSLQMNQAKEIMKENLANHQDWIVLNTTMETLGKWAKTDPSLATWMKPYVEQLTTDPRKSVSKKATTILQQIK